MASIASRFCAALDYAVVAALGIALLCLTSDLWSVNTVQPDACFQAFFFVLHVSVGALMAGRLLELAILASRPYQNRVPSAVVRLETHPPWGPITAEKGRLTSNAADQIYTAILPCRCLASHKRLHRRTKSTPS